jgi:hypothetical protein
MIVVPMAAQLTSDWNEVPCPVPGARAFRCLNGLMVVISVKRERDGQLWKHVSLSRQERVPTYRDLTYVKRVFVGPDHKAIMVLPAEEEHVNMHPNCLHLFQCLDRDPLPDFRDDGGGL